MTRIGQNPLKWTEINKSPATITIATIVYIPEMRGYWEECLQVLKLCLNSLLKNTFCEFDLMVFDNGSCSEVKAYLTQLKEEHKITFLILSEYNLRKLGALNFLLASAPGDIISFADSDVYFLPGWLENTLEVMDAFPEAGQVSALPTRDKTGQYVKSTLKGTTEDNSLIVERGKNLIPERYIDAHRMSLGKSLEAYHNTTKNNQDVRITRGAHSAYVSAQDFQFTTRKEIVNRVLPLEIKNPNDYYDPIYSPVFEARLDELGYWRLSTTDYLVHHIGNRMPKNLGDSNWIFDTSISSSISTTNKSSIAGRSHIKQRILQSRRVRKLLKKINAYTYSMLYES